MFRQRFDLIDQIDNIIRQSFDVIEKFNRFFLGTFHFQRSRAKTQRVNSPPEIVAKLSGQVLFSRHCFLSDILRHLT